MEQKHPLQEPVRYTLGELPEDQMTFSVIAARYQNKWVFCRHKDRETWELPGGHIEAGETPLQAADRELREETGIRAEAGKFELLTSVRERNIFYDHYCLHCQVPLHQIRLQPGETDGVRWATFDEIHEMIRQKEICHVIANQFLHEEPELRKRQTAQ